MSRKDIMSRYYSIIVGPCSKHHCSTSSPTMTTSSSTRRWWSSGGRSVNDVGYESLSQRRKDDHNHCVTLVQKRDYEGYLCGLLLPSASSRESYFAIRAVNVEIASIKDTSRLVPGRTRGVTGKSNSSSIASGAISSRFAGDNNTFFNDNKDGSMGSGGGGGSSMAQRLRMQWWKDAISQIYSTTNTTTTTTAGAGSVTSVAGNNDDLSSSARRNPTLRSVAHAIQTHQLTHRFIRRLIEARELDLDIGQYTTLSNVAQYGEDTMSNILYLTFECVNVRNEKADLVASDIGVGLGILTSLRSTGFRILQNECSIPMDVATRYGVTMDTLHAALAVVEEEEDNKTHHVDNDQLVVLSQEALRNAVVEMADMAYFHLHRAREHQSNVPKEGRMALLPAVCGLQYLNSLKECNYNVLHPTLLGGNSDASLERVERKRRLNLMFLLGRTWLTGIF